MEADLNAAYRYCQALARQEAKNFYYGFLLLPWPQRRAIYAAYAFARRGDDIADQDLPHQEKVRRLAAFRETLDSCLTGTPTDPLFIALRHAVDVFAIPHQYLYELLEGVETDLTVQRYATFQELRRYCYLVASTVGLICIHIFGHGDKGEAREYAVDLGIALQLTNILRDLKEDAGRDRIYLPQEDLRRFGYTEEMLFHSEMNDAFRGLMQFQVERAVTLQV